LTCSHAWELSRQEDKVLKRLKKNVDALAARVTSNQGLSRGTIKAPSKIKAEHGQKGLEDAYLALKGLKQSLDSIETDAVYLIDAKERRPSARSLPA
jgi:hypothetical protein